MPGQYALSFWERVSFFPDYQVVVIGGGLVGLNTAIRLKELDPHLKVLVVERGPIPLGASTRNAGFACFGSMTELLTDLTKMREDEVWALVEMRWRGLRKLRTLLGDEALHFRPTGGYELFRKKDKSLYGHCMENIDSFNDQLKSITGIEKNFRPVEKKITQFGFQQTDQMIKSEAEGMIHTGWMMKTLLEKARNMGVEVIFGLNIDKVEDTGSGVDLVTRAGWAIRTERLVVATNGFAKRFFPELELKAVRNQVLITHPLKTMRIDGCFHYDSGYYYFRNVGNRLLLGGGRNLNLEGETTDQFGHTDQIKDALLNMLEKVILPGQTYTVDQWWSGILGVGPVKKPIMKKYKNRIVLAVRLGGMGVAIGSLIGEQAADLVFE